MMTIYNPFDTFVNAQGNLERRPFRATSFPRACWIRSRSRRWPTSRCRTPEHVDHGDQQLVRAGHFESINRQMSIKMDHNFSDAAA